jgi:hypothetical protein
LLHDRVQAGDPDAIKARANVAANGVGVAGNLGHVFKIEESRGNQVEG